jgi:hypothetical protein
MRVVNQESTIFVDCDDTLIMWGEYKEFDIREKIEIKSPYDNTSSFHFIHKGHIKVLKDRKARGSFIVVWSAGGFAWAEAVVKALGLEEYVDLCMTKPHAYIDDKKAEEFMGEHIYLPYGSGYGD